jgi:DNA-binding PadR family transcriptional regulator
MPRLAERHQGGYPGSAGRTRPAWPAWARAYELTGAHRGSVATRPATFLILTALADGSQHGYGIITEVRQISADRVKLRAGTLYTALDRLRADGLIGVDREEIVEGRLRRYYCLTPAGTEVLAEEAARLQANATAALRRLNLGLAGGAA